MLIKLLRYDVRNNVRFYGVMALALATTLALTLICKATGVGVLVSLMIGIAATLTVVAIVGYFVITFSRMYAQMCGQESYLTYTIPVSTAKTVISKLISGFAWGIVTGGMVALFWWVMSLFLPDVKEVLILMTTGDVKSFLISIFSYLLLILTPLISLSCSIANLPGIRAKGMGVAALLVTCFILYELTGITVLGVWLITFIAGGHEISVSFLNDAANVSVIFGSLSTALVCTGAAIAVIYSAVSARLFSKHRSV